MNTTMDKTELQSILEANKGTHFRFFLQAQVGYKAKLIERLEKSLAQARSGKPLRTAIYLPVPEDHTREYARALAMLKHHQGTTIELDERTYQELVLDDWSWKRQFVATNSVYAGSPYTPLEDDLPEDQEDDLLAAGEESDG